MIRLDAVTLRQLRVLRAVAAHGTLTAAAAALRQTTPAIHNQIKNLEVAVGGPVLARGGGGEAGMRPTPAGEEMLRAATRIEAILSQAGAQVRARAEGRIGQVTLSVGSTATCFVPRLVRMLNDRCPGIEIALRVGNRDSVIADLEAGRCDLAITGRPPRVPAVDAVALGPHPHGVILPPDHSLVGAEGVEPAALAGETFLSREQGSGTRILMYRFLERIEEALPLRIVEMESNETIKQAVMAGLGLAFLSLHTVEHELRAGRLALLRDPHLPVMRHWYLVSPAGVPPAPAARRIAAEIEGLGGVYLPQPPGV